MTWLSPEERHKVVCLSSPSFTKLSPRRGSQPAECLSVDETWAVGEEDAAAPLACPIRPKSARWATEMTLKTLLMQPYSSGSISGKMLIRSPGARSQYPDRRHFASPAHLIGSKTSYVGRQFRQVVVAQPRFIQSSIRHTVTRELITTILKIRCSPQAPERTIQILHRHLFHPVRQASRVESFPAREIAA